MAVTMKALPGKMQEATEYFDKQTAAFRAMKPAGQTALWSYPSGKDTIVTIEQYDSKTSAINWAVNKTHVDGALPIIGLVDLFSAKLYSNIEISLEDLLPHFFKA